MTPELIGILAVGIALAGLVMRLSARTDQRIGALDKRLTEGLQGLRAEIAELRTQISELRERMARLEGLLDGLREAISSKASPAA